MATSGNLSDHGHAALQHSSAGEGLCPVCRSEGHASFDRIGDFDIRECGSCGLRFCDPMVYAADDYDRAYTNWVQEGTSTEFVVPSTRWLMESSREMTEAAWLIASAQAQALKALRARYARGSRVLDVGCGSGWFLAECSRAGFEVYGLEVGTAPVKLLQARGFQVAMGSIDAAPASWPQPDVVTLFEVLEHLPKPLEFLASLNASFPKADIIVSVPSPRRWTKLGGRRDIADFPPNHLTQWSASSLQIALERAGYHDVYIAFAPPTAKEITSAGLRPLFRCWTRPETLLQLSEAIGSSAAQRPLQRELQIRRWKRPLAVVPSMLFRLAGWSGFSMLGFGKGGPKP
jgi:SAM-dependent methyltransferase